MKIGIFVVGAFCQAQYRNAVSGHVQIPLMAAKMLANAGHDVTVITTKSNQADILPGDIGQDVAVHVIEHASRNWPQKGVRMSKAPKHVWQLFSFLRRESFDTVHFFGGSNTGFILGCLKRLGINSHAFFSPVKNPVKYTSALSHLAAKKVFGCIDKFIATSSYVRDGWKQLYGNNRCSTLHPGVFKNMPMPRLNVRKNSVLFWRNAGYQNGADLAMSSFVELAPKYPDVRFVFAVRPHDVFEQDMLELEKRVANIDVHIYPYDSGVTLEKLLEQALLVVQPFRKLSINPQMSILETLYAGVPVITTRIESNAELIEDGQTGLLIPPGDKDALTRAIVAMLENRSLCEKMAYNARPKTENLWNWQSFGKELVEIYENTIS